MRSCRAAACKVTLVAGNGTGSWAEPNTAFGTSPIQCELDRAPDFVHARRQTAGASPGALTVTATKTGVTIASSSGADVGVIYVTAIVDIEDMVQV